MQYRETGIASAGTTAATEEAVTAEATGAGRHRVDRRHRTIEEEGRDETTDRGQDRIRHVSCFVFYDLSSKGKILIYNQRF